MRVVHLGVSGLLAGAALLAAAGVAGAQTTTTMPPVRSIPVTGGQTATTTTAPPARAGQPSAALADTGMAADVLVPLGFALIGGGAALQAAARRRPREAYGLL